MPIRRRGWKRKRRRFEIPKKLPGYLSAAGFFYCKLVGFRIAGGVFGGMFWFCCASAFWVLPHNDFPGLLHNVAFRGLLLTGLSAGKQTLSEDIGRVKKFLPKKKAPPPKGSAQRMYFPLRPTIIYRPVLR